MPPAPPSRHPRPGGARLVPGGGTVCRGLFVGPYWPRSLSGDHRGRRTRLLPARSSSELPHRARTSHSHPLVTRFGHPAATATVVTIRRARSRDIVVPRECVVNRAFSFGFSQQLRGRRPMGSSQAIFTSHNRTAEVAQGRRSALPPGASGGDPRSAPLTCAQCSAACRPVATGVATLSSCTARRWCDEVGVARSPQRGGSRMSRRRRVRTPGRVRRSRAALLTLCLVGRPGRAGRRLRQRRERGAISLGRRQVQPTRRRRRHSRSAPPAPAATPATPAPSGAASFSPQPLPQVTAGPVPAGAIAAVRELLASSR